MSPTPTPTRTSTPGLGASPTTFAYSPGVAGGGAALVMCQVRPFARENCPVRGVWVRDPSFSVETGFRLGTRQLLSDAAATHQFQMAVRDGNGVWTEFSSSRSVDLPTYAPATGTEASIGSGSTVDLAISSPGIWFPDLSKGSGKMRVRKTLVATGAFADETRLDRWPRGVAAFDVKLDSLCDIQARLLQRFWRALNGPQKPFFFDFVDPRIGTRTTAPSNRYIVRFRDSKRADSIFTGRYSEMQFVLIEMPDEPAGGDT